MVMNAPAPWTLQGRGYISMLRMPQSLLDDASFAAESLRGRRQPSPYAYMMLVDYADSPVGPYHELLFIPGRYDFGQGRRHFSISRIFVSSLDSVVNGRRNWGIPKELAQFDMRYGEQGVDRVTVRRDGKPFAEFEFGAFKLPLPFTTALLPKALTTLGQHHEGSTYIYRPTASGWVYPARMRRAWVDAEVFPDLAQARPLLSVAVPRFSMTFHEALVEPLDTAAVA